MNNLDKKTWRPIQVINLATVTLIIAQPREASDKCPHCKTCGVDSQAYGIRWSRFVGLPIKSKPVVVVVMRKRFKCLGCGRTFLQPMSGVDQKHRLHEDAIAYIQEQAPLQTHSSIARQLGIDSKTVFNVVLDWIERREGEYRPRAPHCMGIDEIELMGERRVLITDRQTGTIVDLIPKRSRKAVRTALSRLEGAAGSEMVLTVPWNGYRAALSDIIPHAQLVVEDSYILGCARRCLHRCLWSAYNRLTLGDKHRFESDRLMLRTREDSLLLNPQLPPYWSSRFPLLEAAFAITRSFYTIYDAECRQEAEERYAVWAAAIPTPLLSSFKLILTLLRCWHVEVFRYFDVRKQISCTPRTSALNRIHEQLRNGRGYSFDVLRAKVLFASPHLPEGSR